MAAPDHEVRLSRLDDADAPERINADPYGDGWFADLTPDDPADLDRLLDAAAYRTLIA